jgi:hypothetical protein
MDFARAVAVGFGVTFVGSVGAVIASIRAKRLKAAQDRIKSGEPLREADADSMFAEAVEMKHLGKWAESIAMYESLAAKLAGTQDGTYAKNCAEEMKRQIAESKND